MHGTGNAKVRRCGFDDEKNSEISRQRTVPQLEEDVWCTMRQKDLTETERAGVRDRGATSHVIWRRNLDDQAKQPQKIRNERDEDAEMGSRIRKKQRNSSLSFCKGSERTMTTEEAMDVDFSPSSELIDMPYEQKLSYVNAISRPLANRKLAKRIYRLLKDSATESNKTLIRNNVKDVQKSIRKCEKGIVILGGNVTPIDTYSHIPVLCEDNKIPYVFVPCKEDLQACLGCRSLVNCVMVKRSDANGEMYDKCAAKINETLSY
ncbi:hypothetical protein ACOME3_006692 [Neoechinorhynchus agilis]